MKRGGKAEHPDEREDRVLVKKMVKGEALTGKKHGGEAGGKWIAGAIKHPGALHKSLHVPAGEKIPAKKLEKAEHSKNPLMAKRAHLAETLKGMHHKHGGRAHKYDGGEAMGSDRDGVVMRPDPQQPDYQGLQKLVRAQKLQQIQDINNRLNPGLADRGPPAPPETPMTPPGRKHGGKAEKHPHDCGCARCSGGKVGKKHGGSLSVSDGALEGTRPTGGRMARKDGGRTKGKTNINIIIGTGKGMDNQMGGGQPPTMPPRPPAMPVAVPPPPGAGAPMGMPPGGMPPMMPPGAGAPPPGGMPPMMGRKTGGRVAEARMEFGAGGGKGRLEKIKEYGYRK
jgi:hypothetical protein